MHPSRLCYSIETYGEEQSRVKLERESSVPRLQTCIRRDGRGGVHQSRRERKGCFILTNI
jgi:hypothetical protein